MSQRTRELVNRKQQAEDEIDVCRGRIEYIDVAGLQRLDVRPSLATYIGQLWQRRHFIGADARARAFQDQRDYVLGKFWLIAQPLLDAALYGVIFGVFLQTSRGIDNFIGYLILGITFFGFMSKGLMSGNGLIRSQKNLIGAFSFPRASVVISRNLRSVLDSIPPAIVGIAVALSMQINEPLHWSIVQVIPLYFLLFLFSGGLSFFSARITAFFPDARVIIQFFSRIWFYSSCIFFPIERFAHMPRVQAIMEINPAYLMLQAVRGAVMYGEWISLPEWGILIAWSVGTLVIGLVFFWCAEDKYVTVN